MVHHVWARSLDGRDLFLDPDDRHDLVARLSRVLPEGGAACFGWTLMSNHVHLVVKTGPRRIGTLMQRVFTGYAMRFNGRSARIGHVLQGRFGSRLVRDEGDLLVVIRYVLRNPVEAGVVDSVRALARYPWGAYGALAGARPAFDFESVRQTLALFGPDDAAARARLRHCLERSDEPLPPAASPLDALIRGVCADLAVPEADLRGGRRTRGASRARAVVCQRARAAGIRGIEVARALGLTPAAVSRGARRGVSD
jgi:REP element-mobilizing transposase RayT